MRTHRRSLFVSLEIQKKEEIGFGDKKTVLGFIFFSRLLAEYKIIVGTFLQVYTTGQKFRML
jgi:hypothetical protein